jgi:hypothetical protein
MTLAHTERLYQLLPAILRLKDNDEGQPLRALLAVIEQELDLVEGDIEGLYENWFVETADEWVLPYIGDLLGTTALHSAESAGIFSNRAYIANTLRYRRRKGTAAVLEQLARDVTNWRARAVEFFQLLATTQHMNHTRLSNVRTPDLRDTNQLELMGTPFTNASRTVEVRRIESERGRWNIPNIGLFLWRLQAYNLSRLTGREASGGASGRFWFNPLGIDVPLFNRPQTETEISLLAEERHVPGQLRRRALFDDLEGYRQSMIAGNSAPETTYFGTQPVLQIHLNGQDEALLPEEILICDLTNWESPGWTPPSTQGFTRTDGSFFSTQVGVDPALGRLVVLDGINGVTGVEVSSAYGFSSDVGGGPYNRSELVRAHLGRQVTWQRGVSQVATPVHGEIVSSLTEAVNEWNAQPPGTVGVIAVMDSRTYPESLTGPQSVQVPAGSQLLLVAADWPEEPVPGLMGVTQRNLGRLTPNRVRPHLGGNLSVRGTAAAEDASQGALIIDGLLIEGQVTVLVGNLGRLLLSHCTVSGAAPALGSLSVNPTGSTTTQNDRLEVDITRTILGQVELPESVPSLTIRDSILQVETGQAIEAPGSYAGIERSTILGEISLRGLEASETIFTGVVNVERRQTGCVRFSHVPDGSRTPRRFRCQPDLALEGVDDPDLQRRIRAAMTPIFTSTLYGDPAYMQLHRAAAKEIAAGAEDGAEMGVFNHLKQPQREANLRQALHEYLRFGLAAGIFYVT